MTDYNLIPREGYWSQAVVLAAQEIPPLEPVFTPPALTVDDIRSERDANPAGGKDAWLEYRQKLRDITDGVTDPNAVVWPILPKDKA